MISEETLLEGLVLIHPKIFYDDRGFFLESFHKARFLELGVNVDFVQDNHSFSCKGTLRGMHFQSSPGQAKLVSVTQGKIFDVVVDIRKESPTYMQWQSFILDDVDKAQLFIPNGFAHGFCVLSENAHVQYKVSQFYNPDTEKGFHYKDDQIGIQWPELDEITLSNRDINAPSFREVL
ncbi:MAG: dTDP-4-dehydrorhamnose 3,5-epimerase [Rhabdochlamydiaceae bacterium]|nr:dTDP-4-dehydrorhamnose 3,5-epimerase [Candidatus Amphrikana amoebophyrae]